MSQTKVTDIAVLKARQQAEDDAHTTALAAVELSHGGTSLGGFAPVLASAPYTDEDCQVCGDALFKINVQGRMKLLCAHCINAIRLVSVNHLNPEMVCYRCEAAYDNDGLMQWDSHLQMTSFDLAARIAADLVEIEDDPDVVVIHDLVHQPDQHCGGCAFIRHPGCLGVGRCPNAVDVG